MKHIFIIVSILAIAGIGYWFSPLHHRGASSGSPSLSPTSTLSLSPSSTSALQRSAAPKPKVTVTPKPSALQAVETYQDALKIYSTSGYRFQFSNCQASPGALIMKVRTKFMLDNRDAVLRTITVGQQKFAIGAYGYVIATAPSTIGTHYLTCNGGGTATISVQP